MVRIFLIVAILILFIACINYVNLSTARSILRSKEVSVRKIIGAEKYQLFVQFIIESVLLFLLASLLAFFIIYLLLPLYNDVSGKHLVFNLSNGNVWLVIGSAYYRHTNTGKYLSGIASIIIQTDTGIKRKIIPRYWQHFIQKNIGGYTICFFSWPYNCNYYYR